MRANIAFDECLLLFVVIPLIKSIPQNLVQENMVSFWTGFNLDLPPSTAYFDHCLSSHFQLCNGYYQPIRHNPLFGFITETIM